MARVTQILARRTKNNPILLGEPGVGKTAIAEGLAYAIVHKTNLDGSPLPEFLHTKRVLQLDVGLMIAGAKERGELENRVTKMIAEIRDSGDVVLMYVIAVLLRTAMWLCLILPYTAAIASDCATTPCKVAAVGYPYWELFEYLPNYIQCGTSGPVGVCLQVVWLVLVLKVCCCATQFAAAVPPQD